jgi:hypothetical protein
VTPYVFDDGCCPHGGLIDLDAKLVEARRHGAAAERERLRDEQAINTFLVFLAGCWFGVLLCVVSLLVVKP